MVCSLFTPQISWKVIHTFWSYSDKTDRQTQVGTLPHPTCGREAVMAAAKLTDPQCLGFGKIHLPSWESRSAPFSRVTTTSTAAAASCCCSWCAGPCTHASTTIKWCQKQGTKTQSWGKIMVSRSDLCTGLRLVLALVLQTQPHFVPTLQATRHNTETTHDVLLTQHALLVLDRTSQV